MYKKGIYKILTNEPLTDAVWRMTLAGDTQWIAAPGQFVNIALEGRYLRRPISVCDYDDRSIVLIYKVVGGGTEQIEPHAAGRNARPADGPGQRILDEERRAETPAGRGAAWVCRRSTTWRNGSLLKENPCRWCWVSTPPRRSSTRRSSAHWAARSPSRRSTVRGALGGFVTTAIAGREMDFDYFYACGPLPMLHALYNAVEQDGQLSFEERMGCGFGACMGCSCKTKYGYKRICKEGPVLEKGRDHMVDTSVELCGLGLDNPVVPASGTFGYGNEFREFYDINVLGSFSFKGTTREARFGNPTPRIAECGAGMINAVGLQNPGIDAVIREELPRLKTFFRKPVIANISGFSVEEYAYCCERIDKQEQVGLIEVNVSCPNVRHGGMSFGTCPDAAAEVTRAVKAVTTKPVFIKLSPNVMDIVAIARACEEAGADGICLINTLLGMRIDVARRRPVVANTMGGFSGAAVFPVALRMVYQVARACRIPVMGCGGVTTARDVIEMMMAGATAVQVGAANLVNPYASKEIVEALPGEMERLGIEKLSDIIGIIE